MEAKFSPKVKEVISYSREEALKLNHDQIGIEHLLLGLVREGDGLAIKVLKSLEVDIVLLRKKVEDAISDKISAIPVNSASLPLTKQAEKVLRITVIEAKQMKSETISTEHLMLSILKSHDNIATQIINKMEVDYEVFKAELEYILQESQQESSQSAEMSAESDPFEDEESKSKSYTSSSTKKPNIKSTTPVLDNFGRDITKLAEEDKLDPIVGRESEIERVSQILSRRKKIILF
jgi:ATP-dependent Clp protease ATP-binding subunit ClpC